MALWLNDHLDAPSKQLMEVGDGTLNLLLTWGEPRVVFCTHMDTVPPYIPPVFPDGTAVMAAGAPSVMPDPIGHLSRHCRLRPYVIADLIGNLLRTGREWGRRDTKS